MIQTLVRLWRRIRTHSRPRPIDRTNPCRNATGRRDGILSIIYNRLGRAAGNGVPADIFLLEIQAECHVEEEELARADDVAHGLRFEVERFVKVGRAGALVAAGAGEGDGAVGVRGLGAAGFGPVPGPGVVALVADGEAPGARGLADQVEQVARVVGGEVADVGVVGRFRLGRVVDGCLACVGIQSAIGSCGSAGCEPRVDAEISQGVETIGSSDLCGVDFTL